MNQHLKSILDPNNRNMTPSFIPETTPPFSEDDVSKLPALALLMKLGYQYLSPQETIKLRGGKRSNVILFGILEQQLRKFNRVQFRGEVMPFTEGTITEAIRVLRDIEDDGLVRTNEKIWDLLRLGKSFPQSVNGDTKSFDFNYIDWKNPQNNVYHVTDEFAVAANGTADTRRPDIVLFVNGIPFTVIECKRPGLAGKDPIEEAISQQLRNQREAEIPRLFHYAQFLMALAMNAASYGATGTPAKFWSRWKERQPNRAALEQIVNRSLTEEELSRLFTPDKYRFKGTTPEHTRQWFEQLQSAGRLVTAQDELLHDLCRPERLLEIVDRFTIFDAGERKIARYQQYFCVKRIMERIHQFNNEGIRNGGIVWHTQGSGKSITMVMLANAIANDPDIQDPQIILVTDRVDLDDQIYRTFDHCGVELVTAKTGKHLRELLDDPKARIITTLINKFQITDKKNAGAAKDDAGNKLEKVLASRDYRNDNPNIFVLVDESHRTQFGPLHISMRRVLPKACLIGFTGTPISKKDRNTIVKFGGLIDSYTIKQAVADGAIVPLLYEGRHVPQDVDHQQIDLWFKRYTDGLTEAQISDLKHKFSTAQQLNQTEQKIRTIAWDISSHYQKEWKGTGIKGQVVTPSKFAAILYKKFLDEFGMVTSEVLISPPDTREGNTEVSELRDDSQQSQIQAFWKHVMDRYGSEEKYQKELISSYKKTEEPELIIVVDKLLTGFDAPRNTVLYLTRSLKDHNLLQAIARVNRLFDGKDFGYIIDYYGVLQKLGNALDLYGAMEDDFENGDLDDILTPVAEEWHKLEQRHSDVWEVFQGVLNKQDNTAMELSLADEGVRSKFYERLSVFARTLKLALSSQDFYEHVPDLKIDRYKTDVKFFMDLRASVARLYAEKIDFKQYQNSIQKLLDTHVGAGEIETVVEPVNIFDKEAFQAEIDGAGSPVTKAELIANRTKKEIVEHLEQEDPAFYTPFSQMLEEIIQNIRDRRFDDANTVLSQVEAIRDKVRDRTGDNIPSNLRDRDVAKAYYGIVQENLAGIGAIDIDSKKLSAEIALRIESIVQQHRIVNWSQNSDIQNQIKTAIEDMLFDIQNEHDFELDFDTIDTILEKCINVARVRMP